MNSLYSAITEKIKKLEDTKWVENVCKVAVQTLRMMEFKFKPDRGHEYYIYTFKDIVRAFKGIFSIDIKNQVGNDQLFKVMYNELNRQFLDRLNSASDIAI